jgi:hypothetical protein
MALADKDHALTPGLTGSKYERNLPSPILDRKLTLYFRGTAEANMSVAPPPLKF